MIVGDPGQGAGWSASMTVCVECYSGFKGDERPLRFLLGERWLAVEQVIDRWYDPHAMYFRVRAGDGCFYILRHSETDDIWTVEAFRRPFSPAD